MTRRIAVAIVHGMGEDDPDFADGMIAELRKRFAGEIGKAVKNPEAELELVPVNWAPALQGRQNRLWARYSGIDLDWPGPRQFVINYLADAIAYEPGNGDRSVYDAVHKIYAQALRTLAQQAGPNAPLCIIAHSLGTVITSNYLYDLQAPAKKGLVSPDVKAMMRGTPLEKGETLTYLYTMGSPLALWTLRHPTFGRPIQAPSPRLGKHHPGLAGEWVNYYDHDDILAYPLKPLNDAYEAAVKEDRHVNVGFLTAWTPASHTKYWTDNDVTKPIAKALARAWRTVNAVKVPA